MSWTYQSQLIWKLGDLATETGAVLTGLNANTQCWFDLNTTPTTAGQLTGTSGTLPVAAVKTIDTKGCDALAIAFAGKITAVTDITAATGSGIRPVAFGTPFVPENGAVAWALPYSMRIAQANTVAAGQFNNGALAIFGDSTTLGGMTESDWGESVCQNGLMQADSTTPTAGDYLRWHFYIGRRQSEDPAYTSATARNIVEPTLHGIRSVSIAILTVNASTLGAAPAISMCGEMYAVRMFKGNAFPHLSGVQTS